MAGKKKLINTPESAVDDSLEGLCFLHPGIKLIKRHRVLVRSDYVSLKKRGEVTVLSGGGSGHEPAFGGMIGSGMLTAAVCGPVFTSPPIQDCLAALRLVGRDNPAGVLLIVLNYTGDNLNFGYAAEQAKAEGIRLKIITVADDRALTKLDNKAVGRRGLCGSVFVSKIAGAMAEAGESLDNIAATLERAMQGLGTVGLSLSASAVPGCSPNFKLSDDEMELGLGIHGEAGVERMLLAPAKMTVMIMIDRIAEKCSRDGFSLESGDRVALIVNNLGGTSGLEMNIVVKESVRYLTEMGVVIERLYCAPLITSLEMAGVSLTIMRVDERTLQWLDSPTEAPAWPRPAEKTSPVVEDHLIDPPEITEADPTSEDFCENKARVPDGLVVQQAIRHVCATLVNHETELNAMDSEIGDGDCGTTLARFARALAQRPDLDFDRPSVLLFQLAGLASASMGGTSGALYSRGLFAASKALEGDVSVAAWAEAVREGIESVSLYGKAELGDRTMLDALHPILTSLREFSDEAPDKLLEKVANASMVAASDTQYLTPKAGRAARVTTGGDLSPDPGAYAVALWMQAISDSFKVVV